jgi:hypothetical protein
MARSGDIIISAKTWTEITSGDVTSITFQNKSAATLMQVQATAGSVTPIGVEGVIYSPRVGEFGISLASAFPGVPGANRVWVYANQKIEVFVSHA